MRVRLVLTALFALLLIATPPRSEAQAPISGDFQPPDVPCPAGSLPEPPPINGSPQASVSCVPVVDQRGSPVTGGVEDTSPPQGHFAQATSALADPPPPNPGNFIVGTSFKSGTLPATSSATFASYLEVYPWYVPEEFDPYTGGMYLTAGNRALDAVEFVATYYNSQHNFSPMYPAGIIQIWDWSCSPDYPCYNEAGQELPYDYFMWDAWLPDVPCWYKMLEDNTGHYVNYLYYRNSTFTIGGDMRRNAVSIYDWCDNVWDGVYTHDFAAPTIQDPCSLPGATCTGNAGFVELFDFAPDPPEIVKQGFHHQTLYYDGQVSYLGPDVTTFANNSPWQSYYLNPNNTWEVGTYQDDDGDDVPNSTDRDIDGDGADNWASDTENNKETLCGATANSGEQPEFNPYVRPERIDGVFAGVDDDLDGLIDEALPTAAANRDCDGDGYNGGPEGGTPLCGNGINDDGIIYGGSDDSIVDDGCPGGPAQVGAYSEGQFNIGTTDQDPCGANAWPADIIGTGLSANRVDVQDLTSFLAPVRRLDTSPGHPNFNSRWDLVPGRGLFANWVVVNDMTSLTTVTPPMLNWQNAFNGPSCPWPP